MTYIRADKQISSSVWCLGIGSSILFVVIAVRNRRIGSYTGSSESNDVALLFEEQNEKNDPDVNCTGYAVCRLW